MDVLTLSRIQFGATIAFHYIYPPLSIGLGLMLVLMEGAWLRTGNDLYHQMARFWTRVFALTFAIGVATGIVMEFEFGTNWATYSRFVGDVFGSALAAEGIFAFFLESGFLAVLLFGWDKVGRKMHFFSTCMVSLGAHFSAIWIVVANSWMQTPAGFHIVGDGLKARAEITDFWGMVFGPSSMGGLFHTLCGAWQAGAFLVVSVSAWYLLKNKYENFARSCARPEGSSANKRHVSIVSLDGGHWVWYDCDRFNGFPLLSARLTIREALDALVARIVGARAADCESGRVVHRGSGPPAVDCPGPAANLGRIVRSREGEHGFDCDPFVRRGLCPPFRCFRLPP